MPDWRSTALTALGIVLLAVLAYVSAQVIETQSNYAERFWYTCGRLGPEICPPP